MATEGWASRSGGGAAHGEHRRGIIDLPQQGREHPIHGDQQMPAKIAKGAIFLLRQIGGEGLQRLLGAALP